MAHHPRATGRMPFGRALQRRATRLVLVGLAEAALEETPIDLLHQPHQRVRNQCLASRYAHRRPWEVVGERHLFDSAADAPALPRPRVAIDVPQAEEADLHPAV